MSDQGRELPPVRSGGGIPITEAEKLAKQHWLTGEAELREIEQRIEDAIRRLAEPSPTEECDPEETAAADAEVEAIMEDVAELANKFAERENAPSVRGGKVTDAEVDATMLRLVETVTWSLQDHDGLRDIVRDVLLAASRGGEVTDAEVDEDDLLAFRNHAVNTLCDALADIRVPRDSSKGSVFEQAADLLRAASRGTPGARLHADDTDFLLRLATDLSEMPNSVSGESITRLREIALGGYSYEAFVASRSPSTGRRAPDGGGEE